MMLGFDFKRISQLKRFKEQFKDLGQIGSGGFAEVHKVRHLIDQRIYAAKIVKIKPSFNREDTEQRLYRILSEAKTLALLSHPNILQFHGCWIELETYTEEEKAELFENESVGEDDFEMVMLNESYSSEGIVFGSSSKSKGETTTGDLSKHERRCKIGDGSSLCDYKQIRIYVLSELCQQNLQSFLYERNLNRKQSTLNPSEMLRNYQLALQMISGLNYLHSHRVIHRDIKLHNLMLDDRGRCKLIDFGLAKRVKNWKTPQEIEIKIQTPRAPEEDEEKFSSSIGTKLFSSPQQASSEKYDHRTDIYSLAIVIVLLFNTYTTAHQQRDLLERIRNRNLENMIIPETLKGLLNKSLGAENERASLREFQNCLKALVRQFYHKNREFLNKPAREEHQFIGQDKLINDRLPHVSPTMIRKVIGIKNS